MLHNEGEIDRLVRTVLGVIMLLVGYSVGTGVWQVALYVLGGVMVVTGLTGFCVIYKILGISTNKK
ncbi:MAG TPA: DUF2892 domain-containing protein [Spirochaetia bacterium]|nr:DUF2892 domain-containing protein [Spirochaetia bacterium]